MEELLNQISAETGVPADLLERAARARAAARGVSPDALVAGWAGGEAPTAPEVGAPEEPVAAPEQPAPEVGAPAPSAAAPEPPTPEVAAPAPATDSGAGKLPEALLRRSAAAKAKREGRPLDEVLVEMGLSPEGAAAEAPAAEPAGAAAPAATSASALTAEEAVEEPSAEERVPVFAGFPRWLAASFIVIPMIALLYAGLSPNGPDCGASGQLDINPVTGEVQGCAGDASPFFTLGETTYQSICAACHSADGSGGVGPAFTGGAVLQTFSACPDHIDWVTTGSANWPDATYGDTNKPVGGVGVMPGFGSNLSEQDIASVVLYERVAFGGQDITEAEVDCGLVEAAG